MPVAKLAAVLLAVARWLLCSRSCLGGCLIAMLSALAYGVLSCRLLAMAAMLSAAAAAVLSAVGCGHYALGR